MGFVREGTVSEGSNDDAREGVSEDGERPTVDGQNSESGEPRIWAQDGAPDEELMGLDDGRCISAERK
jgi:hypothetical protein